MTPQISFTYHYMLPKNQHNIHGASFSSGGEKLIRWPKHYHGEVVVPEGIESIASNAFRGCHGVTKVTLPSTLTSIGKEAFSFCSGLKEIIIPDSVTYISSGAFAECINLERVQLSANLRILHEHVFLNCKKLSTLIVDKMPIAYIQMAYRGCDQLKHITVTSTGENIPLHNNYEGFLGI